MGTDYFLEIIRQALVETMIISGPMLGLGMVVGLLISIVQSATQIHEQTLSFVPKLLLTIAGTLVLMPWMVHSMINYFDQIVNQFPALSH